MGDNSNDASDDSEDYDDDYVESDYAEGDYIEDDYVEDDYVEDVLWGPNGPDGASRPLYVGRPLPSRPLRSTMYCTIDKKKSKQRGPHAERG